VTFTTLFLTSLITDCRALRVSHSKPAQNREKFYLLIRYTLRNSATSVTSPRDINTIEYLIRKSTRLIEGWEDKSVKDCIVGIDARTFGTGRRVQTHNS
jgi:succinate dehydrogenase assembly factor 1